MQLLHFTMQVKLLRTPASLFMYVDSFVSKNTFFAALQCHYLIHCRQATDTTQPQGFLHTMNVLFYIERFYHVDDPCIVVRQESYYIN